MGKKLIAAINAILKSNRLNQRYRNVVFCRRVLDYQVRLKIPIAWYLATKFWMYYTWFLYFWPCILAI